ncbi:hypothetical protein [Variovorax sp.]|uniref:hypothetical protein n=1 Tax=Variovorax sp. TaxID=1871043 RepID=UPI003BAD7B51
MKSLYARFVLWLIAPALERQRRPAILCVSPEPAAMLIKEQQARLDASGTEMGGLLMAELRVRMEADTAEAGAREVLAKQLRDGQ